MKKWLPPIFGVLLAAVMAVTSLSAAYARGQASPVGTMVICQGLTVTEVLVDADGQPMAVPHICPDAALALFVETGAAPDADKQTLSWRSVDWDELIPWTVSQVATVAKARGPPIAL